MTVITTTNEIICDDHGLFACDSCVVSEIMLDTEDTRILDLRDADSDADVIAFPTRTAPAVPVEVPVAA